MTAFNGADLCVALSTADLTGKLGAGHVIVNDYLIATSQIQGGHRLTITRGSEVQSMDIMDGTGSGGGGNVPVATDKVAGVVRVGANLAISADGVLSVVTADAAAQDNTRPITSAAVHAQIGNINALLETI